MNYRIAALVIAAAVGPATAESWELTLSRTTLTPEAPSTTVTLWAKFAPTDWAFAGAWVEMHATEPQWSDPTALIPQPGQGRGIVAPDGQSVTDISVGQSWIFGGEPDPANPLPVWEATFTVTDFSEREIIVSTQTSRYEVWLSSMGGMPEARTPIDIEAAIRVIPAPAPLALLALSALAACRRRPRSAP